VRRTAVPARNARAPSPLAPSHRRSRPRIYGTLFLPPEFDPAQRDPVLDHVYPGPQMGRIVMGMILEAYDHPTDAAVWARSSAIPEAGAISGRLLVVHGELDRAVTIHHSLGLIDRLIEANRDFDLLIVPGDDHVFVRRRTYVERRVWDYLTRHLLHREPPADFLIPAE
jgi:dipeptidyl aminopeptidase/acylaminoacyl peptidase